MNKQNYKLDSLLKLIKYPLDTIKAVNLYEKSRFTFLVDRSLTKNEIKYAIEQIFQTSVIKVNTLISSPKRKRVGKYIGKKALYKKAIVFVKNGSCLEKVLGYSGVLPVDNKSDMPKLTEKDEKNSSSSVLSKKIDSFKTL